MNYLNINNLSDIASGLNIEGYKPTIHLPKNCKWYNIVQVIDEPLKGVNFDDVMRIVKENQFSYIEQAVGIDMNKFIDQLVNFINSIAKNHKNVLVHVHQYTGTTILAETLEQRTSIKTILDVTNFFEHPVLYDKLYPDIDALISISQCAGFNIKAGTWIIPTSFMEFDVHNDIIYTNKIVVENNAKEHFPYDHVEGNILIVNDLWNPNLHDENDDNDDSHNHVLLFDDIATKVFDFVKESTQIFDDSHNWQHALAVAKNSLRILDDRQVLYLALLHDVCDHKYKNSIPRQALSDFISNTIPEYKEIDLMIENISFSKQKDNVSKQKDNESNNVILNAVRDGDRIEALGEIGIKRCEQFVKLKGGVVPNDVIIHCYDKLLKLLPDNYIVTDIGRAIATPKHNVIVKYVLDNLPKTNLNYPQPVFN